MIAEKEENFPSLQSLARDSALLALISNNQEERLVAPLVASLETQLGLEKEEGKPGLLQTLLA